MRYDVAIVGGGWAGLSAAIYASLQNKKVLLLEAAPQLGGRSRTVMHQNQAFDNGQHLVIGAYDTLFELFKILSLSKNDFFYQTPFFYSVFDAKQAPYIPLLKGRTRALATTTLKFLPDFAKILWHTFMKNKPKTNENALSYLERLQFSTVIIDTFFAPLILASLTTRIEAADAQHVLTICKRLIKKGATDFYFPKQNLSQLFCDPAAVFLKEKYTDIVLNQRVMNVEKSDSDFQLQTKHAFFFANQVIIAVHPAKLHTLLTHFSVLNHLCLASQSFVYHAITTLYFDYSENVALSSPLVGLLKGPVDWLIDGNFINQPNRILAVISDHKPEGARDLPMQIAHYLHQHFGLPKHTHSQFMITEKRAAFACTPTLCAQRPGSQTVVPGLLLAGDYIQTGLPATLESALLSGKMAAALLE